MLYSTVSIAQCPLNSTHAQKLTHPTSPHVQAEVISKLSQGCTLEAGSLVMTGSPPPIAGADGRPPFLKHGDEVRVWVEGCGKPTDVVGSGW